MRNKKLLTLVGSIFLVLVLTTLSPMVACAAPGYRMIGEFAPMESVWIQWPDPRDSTMYGFHPTIGFYLNPQEWNPPFVELVRECQTEGKVNIIVLGDYGEQYARCYLTLSKVPLDNVFFHKLSYDHPWARDNLGPFCVKDGKLHMLDFGFNAWDRPDWGPYERDDKVPEQVANMLGIGCTHVTYVDPIDGKTKTLIYEGGGFEYSGEGTTVAVWSTIKNRNPNITQAQATQIFKEITGAHTVIWIEYSRYEPDDPRYGSGANHTDGFMKFYAPGKVTVSGKKGKALEAIEKLEAAGWTVDKVEMAWTFMNNLIFGNKVIAGCSSYDWGSDAYLDAEEFEKKIQAGKKELQKLFPDKEIVVIDITILALNGGGIHCVTQQQPRVP